MATKTLSLYSIRAFSTSAAYSKPMFRSLRNRQKAMKLVGWLKRRGHDVFAAKMQVSA